VLPWDGRDWFDRQQVENRHEPFVARHFLLGRALLVFWPAPPMASGRTGFVR
jgi:hypothetical protein